MHAKSGVPEGAAYLNKQRLLAADRELEHLRSTIELFRIDRLAERAGYTITFAIDFSEFYRYLHPDLDRTYGENPDRFYAEQVAIRYLFDRAPSPMLLLKPYYDEFVHHFERVRDQAAVLQRRLLQALHARPDQIPSILREYKSEEDTRRIIAIINGVDRTTSPEIKAIVERARLNLLDLLVAEIREKKVQGTIGTFRTLLEKRRIVWQSAIKGISTDYEIDEDNPLYAAFLSDMDSRRRGRHAHNITDAKAAFSLERLNSINVGNRHLFYLISSARLLADSFSKVTVRIELPGEAPVQVPILREPYYGLLMFYFGAMKPDQEYVQIDKLLSTLAPVRESIRSLVDHIERVESVGEPVSAGLLSGTDSRAVNWLRSFAEELYPEFDEAAVWNANEIKNMLQNINSLLDDPPHFARQLSNLIIDLIGAIQQLQDIASVLKVPAIPQELPLDHSRVWHYSFSAVDQKYQVASSDIMSLLNPQGTMVEKDVLRAQELAAALIAQSPDSSDTHVVAARVLIRLKQVDEAEALLNKAQDLYPQHPEIPLARSIIEKRRGNFELAFKYAHEAAEKLPRDPRPWEEIAFLYWQQKEKNPSVDEGSKTSHLDCAIQYATQALTLCEADNSSRMWILNDLSYYFAQRSGPEDVNRALKHISEALRIQDYLQREEGQTQEGVQKSHHIWETDGYVRLQAYKKLKPKDFSFLKAACQSFINALDIAPDNEYARMHLKECVELLLENKNPAPPSRPA